MEDQNIVRIAVWNIYGPSKGTKSPKSIRKINAFQKAVNPDIAFYLEAPNKKALQSDKEALQPGINDKDWIETYWSGTGIEGNPRGILVVNRNKELHIEEVSPDEIEVEEKKSKAAIAIKISDLPLNILGVWTAPDVKSKSQKTYRETLKNIIGKYKSFLAQSVPCIVIGDTNINFPIERTDAGQKRKRDQWDLNESEISSFVKDFGLEIISDNIREGTLKKNDKMYRCDLMMANSKIHPIPRLGDMEYSDEQGICGSDHRPIIFEISLA